MKIIVTGTDTGVGKTVFAAALASVLNAYYWKPIQSGLAEESDSSHVKRFGMLLSWQIVPEAYRLTQPLSPHRAAELDGIIIDPAALIVPELNPLVIEGAGGALVPVRRDLLYADLFARWNLPTVIVARTSLGTINHSLMTIEALRARAVSILGVAFVGDENEDNEATIAQMAGVKRLGRLPFLRKLEPASLSSAFTQNFRIEDFQ